METFVAALVALSIVLAATGLTLTIRAHRRASRKHVRRDIGTSYYAGICADVDTPIIRGTQPLVTEDVEDGFAR